MRLAIIAVVSVILVGIFGPQFLFSVVETQHVVITRFGEVRRVISSPGLNVKIPFIDTVNTLDKRVLRVDVPVASMPDVENQFLQVDAYARYRITDPRKFLEKLRSEETAASRIGAIVIAELRAAIGRQTQPEIIGGRLIGIEEDRTLVEPQLTADGVPTREAIVRSVRARADATVNSPANDFGVEIIDVRIKRADFPLATEENIFNRMRSERDVQAQRLRAEGQLEFLTRTADVNRQVEIISAEADEESATLRGEGEAEAIRVLAEALDKDPEFFAFLRSLEAYALFLRSQTTLVIPASNDLLQYLQSPDAPAAPTPEP